MLPIMDKPLNFNMLVSSRFIFRYDFDIDPEANHPAAHLQLRGRLADQPVNKPFRRNPVSISTSDY
jgi:hypothetical protein